MKINGFWGCSKKIVGGVDTNGAVNLPHTVPAYCTVNRGDMYNYEI
jgi:hypothetical protein